MKDMMLKIIEDKNRRIKVVRGLGFEPIRIITSEKLSLGFLSSFNLEYASSEIAILLVAMIGLRVHARACSYVLLRNPDIRGQPNGEASTWQG
jgi:hypothetical protein